MDGDLDASIHECTMKEGCKAVFDHACSGRNFYACKEVEINRGISAGCTYQKSRYIFPVNYTTITFYIRLISITASIFLVKNR